MWSVLIVVTTAIMSQLNINWFARVQIGFASNSAAYLLAWEKKAVL